MATPSDSKAAWLGGIAALITALVGAAALWFARSDKVADSDPNSAIEQSFGEIEASSSETEASDSPGDAIDGVPRASIEETMPSVTESLEALAPAVAQIEEVGWGRPEVSTTGLTMNVTYNTGLTMSEVMGMIDNLNEDWAHKICGNAEARRLIHAGASIERNYKVTDTPYMSSSVPRC